MSKRPKEKLSYSEAMQDLVEWVDNRGDEEDIQDINGEMIRTEWVKMIFLMRKMEPLITRLNKHDHKSTGKHWLEVET